MKTKLERKRKNSFIAFLGKGGCGRLRLSKNCKAGGVKKELGSFIGKYSFIGKSSQFSTGVV